MGTFFSRLGLVGNPARQYHCALFIIFILALSVRLIFVFQWHQTPYGVIPLLDAQSYHDWAQHIAAGHILRGTAFYQSPLFPYVLAVLYVVFGHGLLIVGFFNAVLGALTAILLSAVTERAFGRIAALITGLLTVFYEPSIFYTAPVMKEPLSLFLSATFLYCLERFFNEERLFNRQWKNSGALGFLLGLTILVRGNMLFLAPLVPILAAIKYRLAALRGMAIFVLSLMVVLLPVALHNYVVGGDFVPVTYSDGFNLYIGHSATADGTNDYPPEISTDPLQEELNTKWIAEHAAGHPLFPGQISAYWRKLAIDFLREHPERELELLDNKFFAFWNTTQPFDNYDLVFIKKNFPTLLNAPLVSFSLILGLAAFTLCGAGYTARRQVILLSGASLLYMVSVIFFYVTDRYRLPVVIFLLPLAGGAMPLAWDLWQKRSWLPLATSLVIAILVVNFSILPIKNGVDLTAFDLGTLTTMYTDMGRYNDALDTLHRGLAISPIKVGVQAYIRAAEAEEHLGSMTGAMHWLNTARALFPHDGIAWYNYGRMQAAEGNLPVAMESFQKAQTLAPSYTLTYFAEAKILAHDGKVEDALDAVEQGLTVDPYDTRLLAIDAELKQKRSWFFHPDALAPVRP